MDAGSGGEVVVGSGLFSSLVAVVFADTVPVVLPVVLALAVVFLAVTVGMLMLLVALTMDGSEPARKLEHTAAAAAVAFVRCEATHAVAMHGAAAAEIAFSAALAHWHARLVRAQGAARIAEASQGICRVR